MTRLEGRVVATTRDGAPDDPLTRKLQAERATVRVWPTVTFGPPVDPEPLERALARLDGYDWAVFTSARAVHAVVSRTSPPSSSRIAAVGAATRAALEEAGWPVHVTGSGGAVELADSMAGTSTLASARVLFPAASRAARTLEQRLAALGARVDRVQAYRTILTTPDRARVLADLEEGVHAVAFASPSAVTSLTRALEGVWPEALDGCGIAAIGATTGRALVEAGVPRRRVIVATPPGLGTLVEACVRAAAGSVPTGATRPDARSTGRPAPDPNPSVSRKP